jgi:primosomal replication protein N
LNQIFLIARIAAAKPLRYTPAGLPALDLEVEHEGQAMEAGSVRQVKFGLKAQSFGLLAEQLQKAPLGATLKLTGFLDAARGGRGTVLHITAFETLNS